MFHLNFVVNTSGISQKHSCFHRLKFPLVLQNLGLLKAKDHHMTRQQQLCFFFAFNISKLSKNTGLVGHLCQKYAQKYFFLAFSRVFPGFSRVFLGK